MENKRLKMLMLVAITGILLIGCENTSKAYEEEKDAQTISTKEGAQPIDNSTNEFTEINPATPVVNENIKKSEDDTIETKLISEEEAVNIVKKETGLEDLVYIDLEDFNGVEYHQVEGPGEDYVYFVNTSSGIIYVIDPEIANLIPYTDWIKKIQSLN